MCKDVQRKVWFVSCEIVLIVVGGAKTLPALSFFLLLHAAGRTALIRPGRWSGGCKGTPAVGG
jgi:hypothetical protein